MTEKTAGQNWQRALIGLNSTILTLSVLAALYLVREVFIPLALAIFFAFILNPLFRRLHRWGLPRQVAVVIVVLASMILVGAGGWILSRQVSNLVAELPNYSNNITAKLTALRDMTVGSEKWNRFIDEINGVLHGDPSQPDGKVNEAQKQQNATTPSRVIVEPKAPRWLTWLTSHASSAIGIVTQLLLALVLVIFILLNREDLLNRLLRLVGRHNASFTSKAVQEAGSKMSRFLVTQLMVNSTFGVLLAGFLLLLGVKYALLWGFLTTVLRYIPYIGAFLAAVFPITLSLAQFEGWFQPLCVLGCFVVLELVVSNVVEPLLYGKNIGVSEVALLLAAAFWAWMWGGVGLVLSTPLTLVLVTIGRYVTQLNYLTVILGDEPALSDSMNFYQRLLGGDQDDAERLIRSSILEKEPTHLFDEMFIPALHHLRQDYRRRTISDSDVQEILRSIREILEETASDAIQPTVDKPILSETPFQLLGISVRDDTDQLSLEMLKLLLDQRKWDIDIARHEVLSSEVLQRVSEGQFKAICIGTVPPGGTTRTRYLCKRLRAQFPDIKILVGIWGTTHSDEDKIKELQDAGADWVGASLLEARDQLHVWLSIWMQQSNKVA